MGRELCLYEKAVLIRWNVGPHQQIPLCGSRKGGKIPMLMSLGRTICLSGLLLWDKKLLFAYFPATAPDYGRRAGGRHVGQSISDWWWTDGGWTRISNQHRQGLNNRFDSRRSYKVTGQNDGDGGRRPVANIGRGQILTGEKKMFLLEPEQGRGTKTVWIVWLCKLINTQIVWSIARTQ